MRTYSDDKNKQHETRRSGLSLVVNQFLPTATRVNAKTWRSRSRSPAIQLDLRYAIIVLRVYPIYLDANLPTARRNLTLT